MSEKNARTQPRLNKTKPERAVRSARFQVWMTPAELDTMKRAASSKGLGPCSFARMVLMEAARAQLQKQPLPI